MNTACESAQLGFLSYQKPPSQREGARGRGYAVNQASPATPHPNPPPLGEGTLTAWVVFTGQTDLPWLKILKPGFRHCYALLNDGQRWVSLDPLSNYMDVSVHHDVPTDFDLPSWLKSRGHTVVRGYISRDKKEAPWMLFTCVEAVKRMLGIHKRFVITPWQLYRHMTQGDQHSIAKENPHGQFSFAS